MEGIEITHGSRVFILVPCSTHIAGLVYGFYREAKAEQGVELIDATEAGADVEVELLHLCFSVKSVSEQLKILPSENSAFLSISRTTRPYPHAYYFLVTIP
jgi:hypothetical protein